MDVLKWQPGYRYDAIVSGLPFNAFEAPFVDQITKRYGQLLAPTGTLSFFEYLWIPKIRNFFLSGNEKDSYAKTRKTILDFVDRYRFDEEDVYFNLTPAKVYYLQNLS
jgi:phosphatidylethanolamine/phosphatidyl-N-methylethanolamine N-methyltransferase